MGPFHHYAFLGFDRFVVMNCHNSLEEKEAKEMAMCISRWEESRDYFMVLQYPKELEDTRKYCLALFGMKRVDCFPGFTASYSTWLTSPEGPFGNSKTT